jgi:hypothetical protein
VGSVSLFVVVLCLCMGFPHPPPAKEGQGEVSDNPRNDHQAYIGTAFTLWWLGGNFNPILTAFNGILTAFYGILTVFKRCFNSDITLWWLGGILSLF